MDSHPPSGRIPGRSLSLTCHTWKRADLPPVAARNWLRRDARDRAERVLVLDGAVVRLQPDDTGLGREHLGTTLASVEPYAKDGRAELGNLRPCLIQQLVGRRRGHTARLEELPRALLLSGYALQLEVL